MKKTAFVFSALFVLSACGDEPAGGTGYFDAVNTPPPTTVQEPVTLVPETVGTSDELTASLEAALVNAGEAVVETPTVTTATAEATPTGPATIATDDGSLNLYEETFAEQEERRNAAAAALEAARLQYTIIEAGALPEIIADVNIAQYARDTTNEVGQRVYRRPLLSTRITAQQCRKFESPDQAQRYFLANNGPEKDPLNLDPDGDGFACSWSPEYYRQLR